MRTPSQPFLRIEQFSVGVGFFADAFDEGIVFLGVVTLNREPLALHEEYALIGAACGRLRKSSAC